jgi:preprotein translocase SecE subunit
MNKFFKEVRKELALTTFPSRRLTTTFTIFVITFTFLMAVYFGILDVAFGKAILGFINRF